MSWLSTNIISVATATGNFRVSLKCVAVLGAEFWTPLLLTLSSHARAWAGLGCSLTWAGRAGRQLVGDSSWGSAQQRTARTLGGERRHTQSE